MRTKCILFIFALLVTYGLCAQVANWYWAYNTEIVGDAHIYRMVQDDNQNTYVTGYFTGTASFGVNQLTSMGSADIFVAKLNNNREWLWAVRAGSSYPYSMIDEVWELGKGLALDPSGGLVVVGQFSGTSYFGSNVLNCTGGHCDVFVAKLDVNGNWLWASSGGGPSHDRGTDITTDQAGNIFISGTVYYPNPNGTAQFGSNTLTNVSYDDGFIAKLGPSGNWLWARKPTTAVNSHDGMGKISVDTSGNLYLTAGTQFGAITFGAYYLPQIGGSDAIFAKIDTNGNWLWAKRYGGTGNDSATSVLTDSNNDVFVTGYFSGDASFGPAQLTSDGAEDIFIIKLNSDGEDIWANSFGGSNTNVGECASIDPQDNMYVAGYYYGSMPLGQQLVTSVGNKDLFLCKLDTQGNVISGVSAGSVNEEIPLSVQAFDDSNVIVSGWHNGTTQFGAVVLPAESSLQYFIAKASFNPPQPPSIVTQFEPISLYMNCGVYSIDLFEYFEDVYSQLAFTIDGNEMINGTLTGSSILEIMPESNWYGTEYITIHATNQWGLSVEAMLKVTVHQTWSVDENFNLSGALPSNWTTQQAGTTDFPWQPVLIDGDDYAMKTMATTGRTAIERLFSPTYNLSNYKDIVISFDTDFLPYGSGSGTFAYTLNNVTYNVVETFSTSTTGIKTYTLPNLDAKPAVKFRWLYTNTSANTGQDNYWFVDDFSIFGVVRDTQAPSAVNGLILSSQTSNSATLSWQASSDLYFGKYELYVSMDAQVSTADQLWSATQDPSLYNVGTIQTIITGLATGDYWIAIRAVDQSNNASAMSDPVFVHIDGAVPVISTPTPSLQPEPLWTNSRTVEIGCSISDFNLIDPGSLSYRIDANGNGNYDDDEAWTAAPQTGRQIRNRDELTLLFEVSYLSDGVLAFEFKATDSYGNIGYSGLRSQEGISDDWVVRIDSSAPVLSSPVPVNQPEPDWLQTQIVQIGCTIEDMTTIASVEYRFDSNGNDIYDPEEAWQSYPLSRTGERNLLLVELPVEYAVDGTRRFEFRGTDMLGNVAYSGSSSLEGIDDDWVVRMDTTAPTFIDPIPANQPNPIWATLLEVQIGAMIHDYNDIDQSSIMYRVDLNANGIYDPDETWIPLTLRSGPDRNSLSVNTLISVPTDGVYAFEFKAEDTLGNLGYSGMSGINGIEDDWMVKVDTHPPYFSLPVPGNQPLPLWSNNYSVTIGATILDSLSIDMNSVQYRYDQNRNGIYDTVEAWHNIGPTRSSNNRSISVEIEVPITQSADGIYKFEFRACDINALIGYSGFNQQQGIDDDWLFRIDTVPPVAISNFFAQDVTDYSVQLTWTASADINFLGYRIHYSTSPSVSTADPYWDWNNDPNLSLAGSGLVSTVLTGLYPATRYYFMVLATDEVGWVTLYPQVITAMTTSFAEPEAPENLTISIVDGLLILNWDDVTQDVLGNPIIPSYYEVFVGDYPDFVCNFDSLISTVNESYLELDDVIDYADRLFFKVIAHIGMIRNSK